jgi:16S rRNA (guanine527-N7)-methyltransferase
VTLAATDVNSRPSPQAVAAGVRSHLSTTASPALREILATAFLERIEIFASLLAAWGSKTNLTARPSDPAEIAFHILDCLTPVAECRARRFRQLESKLSSKSLVLDLGSGAGFPGLVLAAAYPAYFVLAEARRKRASFLTVAAAEMKLKNVEVWQTNVAKTSLTPKFDLVTAKAFGDPETLYTFAAAGLKVGGLALFYAGPNQSLKKDKAASRGLTVALELRYTLGRKAERVERTAVLWRKLSATSEN